MSDLKLSCGDCKFWGKPDENGKYRSCTRIIHDKKGIGSKEIDSDEWNPPIEERDWLNEEEKRELIEIRDLFEKQNEAYVQDGSGYFAAIKTKKSFACSLFEDKVCPQNP